MNNYNDFVEVGHPNNPRDQSSIIDVTKNTGSVPYIYKITKYAITNYEYIKFLNSVDPDGINTDNIYHEWMNPENDIVYGAIEFDSQAPKGQKYSPKGSMANKPVVYITWYEAARFCNWLHNGAISYTSSYSNNNQAAPHNYGAYDLSDILNLSMEDKKPTVSAKYRLQTSDEWYKAAHYEESNTFNGYHKYPTRSEKIVCVGSSPSGSGIIPLSCEPPNPTINECGILSEIEESDNIYYFHGGPNEWNDIDHWWRDNTKTIQALSLPTKDDYIYVLPGSIVAENDIIYASGIIFDEAVLKTRMIVEGYAHFKNFSSITPYIDIPSSLPGAMIVATTVIFSNGSSNSGDISAYNIKFFGNPEPKAYAPSPRAAYWHFCNGNLENANHINPLDLEQFPSFNTGYIMGNTMFTDTCYNNGVLTGYGLYPTEACDPTLREITQDLQLLYSRFIPLFFGDTLIKTKPIRRYNVKFYGYSINNRKLIGPNSATFKASSYGFENNSDARDTQILNGGNISFINSTNNGFLCQCRFVLFDSSTNGAGGNINCAKNTIFSQSINFGRIVGGPTCRIEGLLITDSSSHQTPGVIEGIMNITIQNLSFSTGSLRDIGNMLVNNYSTIGGPGPISQTNITGNESPGLIGLRLFENPSWFYLPEIDGTWWLNQFYFGNNQPQREGDLDLGSTIIVCGECTVPQCSNSVCYDIEDCGVGGSLDIDPQSPDFGQCKEE
jgi:hypothetical protein